MDYFLKLKDFVSYQFFKKQKISIFVEKRNIQLEFVFGFSCPFWIEFEINADVACSFSAYFLE